MFVKLLPEIAQLRMNIKYDTQYKIKDFKLALLKNRYGKLLKM